MPSKCIEDQLTALGVLLDRCTIKDFHLFETKGIVPDTSDEAYFSRVEQQIKQNIVEYEPIYLGPNDTIKSTNKVFWVGVQQGSYPSEPIPRKRTSCFAARPVLELNNRLIFSCYDKWYYVPDSELKFIQER